MTHIISSPLFLIITHELHLISSLSRNTAKMKRKSVCVFGGSLLIIFSGLIIIFVLPQLLRPIVLTPSSHIYNIWKHVPVLTPMDFYFFNWTNPHDIHNASIKPKFEQVGPYKYLVDWRRSNITWNPNGTVTFRQLKHWFYRNDGPNGDLNDNITTINPVSVGAAHVVRTWQYVVRRGFSMTLDSFAPTVHIVRSVKQLLFEGYPDTLTRMTRTFPFLAGADLPRWDRFGWFYERNGSSEFEGVYNMGTGTTSSFGRLHSWNYWNHTPYFSGHCGNIDGSMGDGFDTRNMKKFIKIFAPEVCRPVTLQFEQKTTVGGIVGHKYILGDYALDNGTKYPGNRCYCSGDCLPFGVFNVSSCRYGSPAFGSLPHFYMADSYYNSLIEGLRPNKEKHEFSVVVEPTLGLPLEIKVRLQISMFVHQIPGIRLFEDVPSVFFPVLWTDLRFTFPESEISTLKLVVNVLGACTIVGTLTILLGLISIICQLIVLRREQHRGREEDVPLTSRPESKSVFPNK